MLRLLPGAALALALSCAPLLAQAPAAARQRPIADTVSSVAAPAAPAPVPAAPPPVVAAAPAQISLPVAATNIAPGETITASMLDERAFPVAVAGQHPVAVNQGQLIGKVARRLLPAGNTIPVAAVAEAVIVTRGVATELRFEHEGLSIRALGVPLESGVLGAMVKLKNVDSGKIVAGVVQADGSVKVSVR